MRRYWPELVLLGLYLTISATTLTWFPFVHSDEAWLASLSREILRSGSLAATEPFFSLTPRHPHAIKTLYHLIQLPFLAVSFSPFAARIPSLIAGVATVGGAWILLRRNGVHRWIAGVVTAALALDVQMLYTAHLARQEALLVAVMLAVASSRRTVIPALALASTVFVHPNALLVGLGVVPWLGSSTHTQALRHRLAVYAGAVLIATLLVLAASFAMDPMFLSNYLAFGDAVGVTSSPLERLLRFRGFFEKLMGRVAGTYYLPPFRPTALLAVATVALSLLVAAVRRRVSLLRPTGSLLAVALGLFAIGKYSPPSVVFLVPWVYLQGALTMQALWEELPGHPRIGIQTVLVLFVAALAVGPVTTAREVSRWYPQALYGVADSVSFRPRAYRQLEEELRRELVRADLVGAPILANLNTAFMLDSEPLLAFRDLGAIPRDAEQPVLQLLQARGIRAVLLPRQEMDLIYRERPVWNAVYGNPSRYYRELQSILENHATRVAVIPAPVYGMRLVSRLGTTEPPTWELYRLSPDVTQ